MRKWWNCTFLHSVRSSPSLLKNKQVTSMSEFQPRVLSSLMHSSQYSDGENRRGGRSGRNSFAGRARVRDDPGMRAPSRRTVCDRARHGLAGPP